MNYRELNSSDVISWRAIVFPLNTGWWKIIRNGVILLVRYSVHNNWLNSRLPVGVNKQWNESVIKVQLQLCLKRGTTRKENKRKRKYNRGREKYKAIGQLKGSWRPFTVATIASGKCQTNNFPLSHRITSIGAPVNSRSWHWSWNAYMFL